MFLPFYSLICIIFGFNLVDFFFFLLQVLFFCFFVCPVNFEWMPGILDFTLLAIKCFCIVSWNCVGLWGSVWPFRSIVRWKQCPSACCAWTPVRWECFLLCLLGADTPLSPWVLLLFPLIIARGSWCTLSPGRPRESPACVGPGHAHLPGTGLWGLHGHPGLTCPAWRELCCLKLFFHMFLFVLNRFHGKVICSILAKNKSSANV